MPDIEDLYSPPNGPGYEKRETRTGLPLEYVGEKLRRTVEYAYETARLELDVRSSVEIGTADIDLTARELSAEAYRSAAATLRYAVHAYLALQNMLGLMNADDLLERLIRGTRDDLKAWLDTIQNEGSSIG
jgi:hypothetical protein